MFIKKTKILIIEDDKFLLKAYNLKMKKAGFEILTAMDGITGLKLAEKKHPSLIILDLMLPKMDGFEFLKRIKSDDVLKDIPVVTISVLGQKKDYEKAMRLGAEEYFIKSGYTLEEIIKKIKKYL
jgi:DNA-binding response OmpR family regulator